MSDSLPIFNETSAYSLAFVAFVGVVAVTASRTLLPKTASWQDKFTFIWLAFDAGIHFVFEGSFLYYSLFGRQVNTNFGPALDSRRPILGKDYARADARWGFADPTIVSMEILTVLGAGTTSLPSCYSFFGSPSQQPAVKPAMSQFTTTSAYALTSISAVGVAAIVATRSLLPKTASVKDKFTFIWLAFDVGIHAAFDTAFLYFSLFGRQVNTSAGPLAQLWKDYARADARWGVADPTIVSMELITVIGTGATILYIMQKLVQDDPARHYWIIVLCTAELYGGWMTFAPEWLSGCQNLNTGDAFYLWCSDSTLIHVTFAQFLNTIWVFIPVWLMFDSYRYIARSLRVLQKAERAKKA
ncbi:hypothetical protein IEO21_08686 [Rhodonia placenta]|uniref:EXPERA domain-containing protein n=1 Tax=Rhodonia placenta TaxID=104341 RepID=A0A8H7TYL2_9APHY|nr:hypothetical protein IEO21_08686 [Postia placenta]